MHLATRTKHLLPPSLAFDHTKGDEIATKHQEAIRQLFGFAHVLVSALERQYELGNSTIRKILSSDAPGRNRVARAGETYPP